MWYTSIMGALRRHHHEVLVREFIRTGGNGAEAYRRAAKVCIGKPLKNKHSPKVCAGRILAYPEVKARLQELQAQMAKRADITVDKILSDYQRALNMAEAMEKPADMVAAATSQAKLVGLLRDRVEAGNVGDFDKMDNISDILERVAEEAGPEAALALSKAFGLGDQPSDQETAVALPNEEIEADLAEAKPASDAVN